MKSYPYGRLFITTLLILLMAAPAAFCSGDKDPESEEDYYKLGLKLFREGYYELMPQGKVEEGMKKLDQAVKAFETAISIKDARWESHWHLARIFSIEQKLEKAAAQYKRVIEMDPENTDHYLFLASVYVQMKQFSEARNVLDYAKTRTEDTQAIERIDALVKSIQDQAMTP
jgi:tetratricopeptide (TPR) repeat protein